MKMKTSMKVTDLYKHTIAIGYCGAQHLLSGQQPKFYNSGIYGWNNDIYTGLLHDTCIVTGYRNLRGICPNYETLRYYEKQAEKVCGNWDLTWEEKQDKLNLLLNEFIEKTITA